MTNDIIESQSNDNNYNDDNEIVITAQDIKEYIIRTMNQSNNKSSHSDCPTKYDFLLDIINDFIDKDVNESNTKNNDENDNETIHDKRITTTVVPNYTRIQNQLDRQKIKMNIDDNQYDTSLTMETKKKRSHDSSNNNNTTKSNNNVINNKKTTTTKKMKLDKDINVNEYLLNEVQDLTKSIDQIGNTYRNNDGIIDDDDDYD